MAQAKAVRSGVFVAKGRHQAPGRNVKQQRHPYTTIFGRRFSKSYRQYGYADNSLLIGIACIVLAGFLALASVAFAASGFKTFLFSPVACSTK